MEGTKQRERRLKSEGTQRIYEDNKWVIVRPFTIEASRMYGGGTKWCTSLKKDKFKSLFYAYIETGILYYILKKGKNPLDDKLNKVCLYKKWSGEEEWVDTHDTIKEEKTIRKYKKELGEKVLNYLLESFSGIINEDFTSQVERDLDRIVDGDIDWIEVIRKVYKQQ